MRVDSYVHVETTSVVWAVTKNTSVERGDEDASPDSNSFLLYVRFGSKFGDQRRMRVPVSSTDLVRVADYRFPIATSTVVLERGVAATYIAGQLFALRSSDADVSEILLMSSLDGKFFRPERVPDAPDAGGLFEPGQSNIFPVHVVPNGNILLR
jgi:hypothetical protein